MKDDETWIPDRTDLDWIESLSTPLNDALLGSRQAGEPDGIPIVSATRAGCSQVLAAGRRRIVEVGTAIGYSTLWLALGQPDDGTIVTIDPDSSRTDRPAVVAARGDRRRADHRGQRPGAEAFGRRPGAGRAIRARVHRRPQARVLGLPRGTRPAPFAGRARRRRQRPVERPRFRLSPERPRGENTMALRSFDSAVLADPRFRSTILPLGDGLLVAAYRG